MNRLIKKIVRESIEAKRDLLKNQLSNIEKAAKTMVGSLEKGGKILIFGNGGSAADSQHIAAELVGRFKKERSGLAAIALNVNTSTMTALANDYGYEVTFSRQIAALGKKGDVALGISTSGNAKNVIAAMKKAREVGLKTIGLTGAGGGILKAASDISIIVNSKNTARIQEAHIMIGHIICELIENAIFVNADY